MTVLLCAVVLNDDICIAIEMALNVLRRNDEILACCGSDIGGQCIDKMPIRDCRINRSEKTGKQGVQFCCLWLVVTG